MSVKSNCNVLSTAATTYSRRWRSPSSGNRDRARTCPQPTFNVAGTSTRSSHSDARELSGDTHSRAHPHRRAAITACRATTLRVRRSAWMPSPPGAISFPTLSSSYAPATPSHRSIETISIHIRDPGEAHKRCNSLSHTHFTQALVESLYPDGPDSADPYVGGLLEGIHMSHLSHRRRRCRRYHSHLALFTEHVPGAGIGPLFRTVIMNQVRARVAPFVACRAVSYHVLRRILPPPFGVQFERLRNGDRFWYERKGMFSANELAQIYQTVRCPCPPPPPHSTTHSTTSPFFARIPFLFLTRASAMWGRVADQSIGAGAVERADSHGHRQPQHERQPMGYRARRYLLPPTALPRQHRYVDRACACACACACAVVRVRWCVCGGACGGACACACACAVVRVRVRVRVRACASRN